VRGTRKRKRGCGSKYQRAGKGGANAAAVLVAAIMGAIRLRNPKQDDLVEANKHEVCEERERESGDRERDVGANTGGRAGIGRLF
jgi:hypothetical protein